MDDELDDDLGEEMNNEGRPPLPPLKHQYRESQNPEDLDTEEDFDAPKLIKKNPLSKQPIIHLKKQ